ncbi:MAG TPA: D-2-hydroxyacid dehydrogenase [Candidatus Acidoferrales bacterium]|nr:D-2-hydroxyacid dehydrogenase [Candidatus Acidoferrales bacterium]
MNRTTTRTTPAETKLVICIWHKFTLWQPPPEFAASIRRRWPAMKVVHLPTYDHIVDELPDTDILVGFSLRREQFSSAKKLKWIHSTAAGVGQLMYPELRQSGIVLTNARGIHSAPMAEHILGMLIAMSRRFPDAFRFQRQAHWAQQEIWDARPFELKGKTLLIVGFGSIGHALARIIQPIGMRIWGVTRSGRVSDDGKLAERILPAAELHAALPQADFVLLAAPETPDTQRMIGEKELASMKRSAYLLNVARGTLVDQNALIAALRAHTIAGAALDVTEDEPLPSENPLWKLDNVFITPHVSAATDLLWQRQQELLLENLERWFDGRELLNRVDLQRGY